MAKGAPAFQFYPKDFLSDLNVIQMSNTEVGIYVRLLCHCWIEGCLPLETSTLAHMAHLPLKQFTKLWEQSVVKSCFRVGEDGKLHHKRLDQEREKQDTFRRRQSDNGRRGGRPQKPPDENPPESQGGASGKGLGLADPEIDKANESSSSAICNLQSADCSQPRVSRPDGEDETAERAARFIDRYCELFTLHRKGARYHRRDVRDFHHAEGLVRTWDDARLEKLAVIFLNSDDPWIEQGSRTIGQFAARASWCDDRLRQHEARNGSAA